VKRVVCEVRYLRSVVLMRSTIKSTLTLVRSFRSYKGLGPPPLEEALYKFLASRPSVLRVLIGSDLERSALLLVCAVANKVCDMNSFASFIFHVEFA
jgi:hypothetical protein